jgi:antitoxin MazE
MKARLVRIGNSRGIRLPKPVIEQAGLAEEVDVQVRDGAVVITSAARPRSGWAAAARRLRERRDGPVPEAPAPTRFDEAEWEWK